MLAAARDGVIDLFTSTVLLAELQDVLQRPKFSRRLKRARVQPRELIVGYAALTAIVRPSAIPSVITADPEDDHVLACATAAQTAAIVSGDSHLLNLTSFQDIPILTANDLLARIAE